MIFMIIDYFDFMILNQSMALFNTQFFHNLKIPVTSLPTLILKSHFFQKFNDSFQIMNWIITPKIYKKVEFFPLFFLPKRKFFHEKKSFFSRRKLKISKWGRFSKSWKVMVKIKNFPQKNLEKVDHVIVSKSNFQRKPSIFFNFPFNQNYVKKLSFFKKIKKN